MESSKVEKKPLIENYDNSNNSNNSPSLWTGISGFLYFLIFCYAIFLSFSCNPGGFDFGAFLAACCCPWLYIPYKIATMKSWTCWDAKRYYVA